MKGKTTSITVATAIAVALVAGGAALVVAGGGGEDARQALVAERGRKVMPFDLERTTHRFAASNNGGLQTVVSDDADPEQIALIRAHLRKEARRFRRGVFADPITIHGPEMPGVADIRAGSARIEIAYSDVPSGGQLRYRTGERELVEAIHRWFDAQTSDHGEHVEGDH